jgi:hypothetical protein
MGVKLGVSGHRQRVFENRVMRRIFGPKRRMEEVSQSGAS